MEAILALHDSAMRRLTDEEKESEKEWVERESGCSSFRDGWCTGDGTLVALAQKPGLDGEAYFSRKMTYALSVQVCSVAGLYVSIKLILNLDVQIINIFSNLRIVDYVVGFTRSAHDSSAFQYSSIARNPEWFFNGNPDEFMWADSAYSLTPRVIPVHKRPAADLPHNRRFDTAVSHIRIRSEHCIGALKGRWQSLRELPHRINRKRDHVAACNWIKMCIVLHNLLVDFEGDSWAQYFRDQMPSEVREVGDLGVVDHVGARLQGEQKRNQLVMDYLASQESE